MFCNTFKIIFNSFLIIFLITICSIFRWTVIVTIVETVSVTRVWEWKPIKWCHLHVFSQFGAFIWDYACGTFEDFRCFAKIVWEINSTEWFKVEASGCTARCITVCRTQIVVGWQAFVLDILMDMVHNIPIVSLLVGKLHRDILFTVDRCWSTFLISSNKELTWKQVDPFCFRVLSSRSVWLNDLIDCFKVDVLSVIVVSWEVCAQDLA